MASKRWQDTRRTFTPEEEARKAERRDAMKREQHAHNRADGHESETASLPAGEEIASDVDEAEAPPLDRVRRVFGCVSIEDVGALIGASPIQVGVLARGRSAGDPVVQTRLARADRAARLIDDLVVPEDISAWLHTPVEALKGRTPRQALMDPVGTERLIGMLAAVADGGPGPDATGA